MRTGVRQSSVDAYMRMFDRNGIIDGQRAVLAAFKGHGDTFTRAELEKATGLRLGSVCGRVFELVRDGMLEELPRRICTVTGESSHALRLASAQRSLFGEAA